MSIKGEVTYVPTELNNSTITFGPSYSKSFGVRIPDMRKIPIKWDNPSLIPQSLRDQISNLGDLLTNPVTSKSLYYTTLTLTGSEEQYLSTGNPTIAISSIDGTLLNVSNFVATSKNNSGYDKYDSTVNINQTTPKFGIIQSMNIVANRPDLTYNVINVTLTISINVTLVVSCSGSSLATPACQAVCNGGQQACFESFVDYCFPERIGVSQVCQGYFKDYIEQNGPSAALDDKLTTYCTQKYDGFKDLFGSGNAVDKDMCACHMSPKTYDNFEQEVAKKYPTLVSGSGILTLCLLPECQNSNYQAQPIPKGGCKTPNCLIINEFDNEGTFTNSTINTNINGCVPGNNQEETDYTLIIVVIVIVIVLALLMYLLVR